VGSAKLVESRKTRTWWAVSGKQRLEERREEWKIQFANCAEAIAAGAKTLLEEEENLMEHFARVPVIVRDAIKVLFKTRYSTLSTHFHAPDRRIELRNWNTKAAAKLECAFGTRGSEHWAAWNTRGDHTEERERWGEGGVREFPRDKLASAILAGMKVAMELMFVAVERAKLKAMTNLKPTPGFRVSG
jgi:hypothetical protein